MTIEVRSLRSPELGNMAHVVIEAVSGLAVVVDAVRDVAQYLEVAAAEGVRLAWALETHVHNDFVSGGRELVVAAGARLGASGDAGLRYPYERLGDGDEIELGAWRLRVLGTPGHTPEHVAYLLLDPAGEPQALFSGGALMVGTAARTDLFGPALAWRFTHDLERSLKERILGLADQVVVYPTHGGGSFCAAGAGSAPSTTIGAERSTNPLATTRSSRQFVIRALNAGTYPAYYARMRGLNQAGAALLGPELLTPPAISLPEADTWAAQGALLVDVRPAAAFRLGHIPRSIAAGADGNLSSWVGWLVAPERALVLVADPGADGEAQVIEATRQLARIGYDRVVGALSGGIDTWRAAGRTPGCCQTVSAAERQRPRPRHPGRHSGMPRGIPLAVHCGHDYRATLGATLLGRAEYDQLVVVDNGWEGWAALDHDQP